MKKLLIYGAGAIGRGYLPRVFKPEKYQYYFVEKNPAISQPLKKNKSYTSYVSMAGRYDIKKIWVADCFDPGKEEGIINQVDAILVAVGPRNFMQLKSQLQKAQAPTICFENDDRLPELMSKATGNSQIFFGIPDVITSNTAPLKFLQKDPLSIVSENGECFIDSRARSVGGDCHYVSPKELKKQWLAKLYIHNTPHCVAAYLGNILQVNYLHETMQNRRASSIIKGVMLEMKKMVFRKYRLDKSFLSYYANKELQRFGNILLFDPISRVAREPFRKLAPNERLIGAATLCLSVGFIPENLIKGIMAAFCFENDADQDFHIKHLMQALLPEEFLRIIIRLRPNETLFQVLVEQWDKNLKIIKGLRNEK